MADTSSRQTNQAGNPTPMANEVFKHRQLFNIAPNAMALVDANYTYLMVNDAFLQRLHKRRVEVEGHTVAEICGEVVFQTILKEKIDRCLSGETVYLTDWFVSEQTGPHFIHFTFVPYQDEPGHIVGVLSTGHDLTNLSLTKQALQRSERESAALLHAIPDLMFTLSRDGRYLNYKAERTDLHHQAAPSLLGLFLQDTSPPEFSSLVLEQIARTLDSDEMAVFEFDLSNTKGQRHWEARMVPSGEDQVTCIVRDMTEQRRADQALRESEYRFRQLTENISEVFWLRDLDSNQMLYVSPAYEQIWGTPVTGLMRNSRQFLDAVHPEDWARVQTAVVQQQESNLFDEIFRIIRPDKTIRWIHARTFPVRDSLGVMYRVAGLATDITYQKKSEEALQVAADIMRAMPVGLFIYQYQPPDSLKLVDANPIAEQSTGITLAQSKGKEFVEIWPNARDNNLDKIFLSVVKTGKPLEINDFFYQDEQFTTHFYLQLFAMPGNRLGVGFKDIGDIKKARAAEEEQRLLAGTLVNTAAAINQTLDYDRVLALVLENIGKLVPHDGTNLMLLDDDGQTVRVAAYCPCYAANGLPQPPTDVGWPLSEYPHLREMIDTERPLLITDTHDHKTWIKERAQAIRSYLGVPLYLDGKMIGLLNLDSQTPGFFTEKAVISAQQFSYQAATAIRNAQLHKSVQEQLKQLQDAQHRLVQSEKLAAIGELVSGVAHELNNPLSGVILYAQLLQMRQGEKYSSDVEQIVTQAHRAATIVRGLLDFARQRPPEKSRTEINKLLENVVEFMAYELRTHNIEVSFDLDPDLPPIIVDPHQMQQVFLNLITNAMQAANNNGRGKLWIRTSTNSPNHPARRNTNSPTVQIMIRDDGPGIHHDIQSRIFDPFFTTKPIGQGTGLGLSVCHGIISEHGGEIWLESEVDKGATFFITLPLNINPTHQDNSPRKDQEQKPLARPGRILLVDDEVSILNVLSRVLTPHEVDCAQQGALALQKIAQQDYDVILCDVHMPGMGGLEFFDALRETYPHLTDRVVFMTGDTVSASISAQIKKIDARTLAKPFDVATVLATVQDMLS